MGGYGSTRWGGHTKRITVEECRRIDVRKLRREGVLQEGQVWRGSWAWWNDSGEKTAWLDLTATDSEITLTYRIRETGTEEWEHISYTVPVVWTGYHFGGRRPFFLCPNTNCRRRVEILFLPSFVGGVRYYLCRHCYGLSYESTQKWDKRLAELRRNPMRALAILGRGYGAAGSGEYLRALKALYSEAEDW